MKTVTTMKMTQLSRIFYNSQWSANIDQTNQFKLQVNWNLGHYMVKTYVNQYSCKIYTSSKKFIRFHFHMFFQTGNSKSCLNQA